MKRIITIHGWASPWSGRNDIDTLEPTFIKRGYEVSSFDYGWHLIITPNNPKVARKLAAMIEPNDILVTHSNGAHIALLASRLTTAFSTVVLIRPALDTDAIFGIGVKRIIVYYSPFDPAIQGVARWIPFKHPWGAAGSEGMDDPRAENYNASTMPDESRSFGHLDWSFPNKRVAFANAVCDRLEEPAVREFEAGL